MKITTACAFLCALCATATFAQDKSPSCWPWPDSMEATIAAPRDHKILYQDPNIRFLEVTNRLAIRFTCILIRCLPSF